MFMEKLYTVEDIAQMTSMTTRTIRNYLKDGILTGRKIGGQWRFTEGDVGNFMDSGNVSATIISERKQEVLDFLDGIKTDYTGEVQVCTIVDLYHEKDIIYQKRDNLVEFINSNKPDSLCPKYMKFSFEYIESESKGRIVLFAAPNYLIEALKILQ